MTQIVTGAVVTNIKIDGEPLGEGDTQQLIVLLEAFDKYRERNGKYKDLWKEGGAADSADHIKSKAARVLWMLRERQLEDLDDAVDLINYAVFFIRNVREGRIT